MSKWIWVIIILVILGAGIGAFFLGRRSKTSDMIDELATEKQRFDSTLTEDEARAEAAAEVTAASLKFTQMLLITGGVGEWATTVERLEEELARVEEASILVPDEESAARAAALEAEAQAARAELRARWMKALEDAEKQMAIALEAASIATSAAIAAKNKVIAWEGIVATAEANLEESEATLAELLARPRPFSIKTSAEKDLERAIELAGGTLEIFKAKLDAAEKAALATKISANAAISDANDIVERVLTITADVLLLGILLALANRVDAIAKATRTRLKELSDKL